jgi:hypothetical protein
MKKIMIAVTLVVAALNIVSCNPKELLKPGLEPAFVVIDGDTIKTRDDKGKVFKHDYSQLIINGETIVVPNYKKNSKKALLKSNEDILKKGIEDLDLKGQPLRVVATGFSGFGTSYNNEAIDFSVSNLIATQMGVDFRNPYFEPEDYNGIYTYVPSDVNHTGGPVPKFKIAKNNLAVESIDLNGKAVLKKVKPGRIDNFVDGTGGKYDMGEKTTGFISENYRRIGADITYDQRVLKEKFDFLIDISFNEDRIMEKGFTGYSPRLVEQVMVGGIPSQIKSPKLDFFSDIAKRKYLKGVLINNSIYSPYLTTGLVTIEQVRKELDKYQKGELLSSQAKQIHPDARIDSLLGSKINMNNKPFLKNNEKILSFYSFSSTDLRRNYELPKRSKLAEQLNWPEVDVNFIYNQIYDGKYFSHDGVKVEYKQLYTQDLMGSSKLSQIIIANEALKLINSFYGTNFPYISTVEFIK